jgi:mannose-1-phosphate guanylyltransferase
MFQSAVDRITPLFPISNILVVTRAEHAPLLMAQVPGLPAENFILEPQGRGTAPAIGLVAAHLSRRDPHAIMAVLTADHFITATERFCRVLRAAEGIAAEGSLVTLGIEPASASTGFGYIQHGSNLGEKQGFRFFAVRQFTEKPDPTTAQTMVASGEYSWNSGMFVWQVARILEEFACQMPDFSQKLVEIENSIGQPEYQDVLEKIWPTVVKQTIDYGVMEGARQVVVIPIDIGWTDIGSWGSLLELLPRDANQNVFIGKHLEIDTKGTLVFGGERLVATMGVEDLVIIDTEDALMVCTRDREQDVKAIVEKLTAQQQVQFI